MKIIKYLTIIILVASCEPNPQNYFAGTIEYEVVLDTVESGLSQDELNNIFGNYSILNFADGSYFQIYHNASIEFDYMDAKSARYFLKKRKSDTIFSYNAKIERTYKFNGFIDCKDSKEILGYNCQCLSFETIYIQFPELISYTFFYSNMLKIDPNKSKDIKYGFSNKVNRKIKSIPLEMRINSSVGNLISTAVRIEQNNEIDVKKLFQEASKDLPIKIMN